MTFNFCFLWYFLCVYVCLQILTRPRLNAYWLWHLGKRSRFKPALLLAFKINVCSVCILVFTYRSNSLKISLTAYYVFVISDSPPFLLLVALRHGRASETNILSGERRVGFAATLRRPTSCLASVEWGLRQRCVARELDAIFDSIPLFGRPGGVCGIIWWFTDFGLLLAWQPAALAD